MKKQRISERFDDFARIICDQICVMNGRLLDISNEGLKAEFNAPCDIDNEKEYEISIRLSRINTSPFEMIVRPMWSEFADGKTTVGFSILPSKDSARLENYIQKLKDDKNSEENYKNINLSDPDSLFI